MPIQENKDHAVRGLSSVEKFADRNDIARTRAFEEIKHGRLRAVKVGRLTRITPEDEAAWRAALPARPAQPRNQSAA
jgi:hypothetical protein